MDCPAVKLTLPGYWTSLTESSFNDKFPINNVNIYDDCPSAIEVALIDPKVFGIRIGKIKGDRSFGEKVKIPFDKSVYCPDNAKGKCHNTIWKP